MMSFSLFMLPFIVLLLDKLFGEMPTRCHPVCFVGNLALKVETCLRKGKNGNAMFWHGLLAWFFVLFPCLLFVIFTTSLPQLASLYLFPYEHEAQFVAYLASYVIAIFWTWICIAPRSLAEHAIRVAKPLEEKDLGTARKNLSMMVGRNTQILDAYAVARACIESVAENLTDSIVASIFWAMFGVVFASFINAIMSEGLKIFSYCQPICIVFFITLHRVTNTLDAMWGKKNEKYINFGTMSAITDDILNYLPARLALFCVAFASMFIKNCHSLQALYIGFKYRNAHESPNSAWTESAFAGALNLKLGGLAQYIGITVAHPSIGEGSLQAKAQDIYTAIKLMWASSIVFACLISFLTKIIFFFFWGK